MKALDFSKMVIWACLLVIGAGVGGHYYLKGRAESAEKDKKKALFALRKIAMAREDIRVLEDEMDSDAYLRGKNNGRYGSFFSEVSKLAKMEQPPAMGEPRSDVSRTGEFTDTSRELFWPKSRRKKIMFRRDQIAAFLWKLEDRTNLLKVTQIKLETNKETRDDLWSLRLWVTERMPNSSSQPQ